jgi:hypothetical protein
MRHDGPTGSFGGLWVVKSGRGDRRLTFVLKDAHGVTERRRLRSPVLRQNLRDLPARGRVLPKARVQHVIGQRQVQVANRAV